MNNQTNMFADERYKEIIHMLNEKGSVSVSELTERFHISTETVRRDLIAMESQGELKRVHGGAIRLAQMKEFKQVALRKNDFYEEKHLLSETGIRLIREGDIISIDSGSTAVIFANTLKGKFKSLTIITHSLEAFKELESETTYKKILVGGEYLESESAFYGELAIQFLSQLHIGKAFIFPSALSIDGGAEDFITELVPVQKAYMKKANQVYIMSDSSKFEKTALLKLCDLETCSGVITDDQLDQGIYERYIQANINVIRSDGRSL